MFTGREPGGSRGSGGFLVSSWTASGPQSSQSPSSGPGPQLGRSPRRRDTRLGSRPPRQRRESPGLGWDLMRELRGNTEELTLQGADVVGPEPGLLCEGNILCVQIHGHDQVWGWGLAG